MQDILSKYDAIVVFSAPNRFYLTRFNSSYGCVIITKTEKVLITDFRYEFAASTLAKEFNVVIASGVKIYEVIKSVLTRCGAKSVGYEDEYISVSEYKKLKSMLSGFVFKPLEQALNLERSVKTEDEISCIAAAQRITESALERTISLLKPGVTERDINAELICNILKQGGDGTAFDSIVAFGENTANCHHKATDKKLERNDMILIDCGAKYKGYCSDMTRTFCLGEPPARLAALHRLVLSAQQYILKFLRAGMTGKDADTLVREFLKANGYEKEFGHSLGHGVGVEIHEQPRLSQSDSYVLREGNVVTVEPGLYINGVGGARIEDMVIIKKDGIENLTKFSKSINIERVK